MSSKIFAVVISFNPNIQMLNAEYESIASQVEKIIYIDNFSNNREIIKKWIEDKPKANAIWINSNEGVGVAQNAGIRLALDEGASHIIIFDQDSVVSNDFVEKLYSAEQFAINDGINVGITGPIYVSHDDLYEYPIMSIENGKFVKIPTTSFATYTKVSHIIASGSLIRREVFEKVGLLTESFFIGYMDHEYCFRSSCFGYDTIVTNTACMKHQLGDRQIMLFNRKIGIYSPFRRYFDCRNTILIQKNEYLPQVFRRHYLKLVFGKFILSCLIGPNRLKQLKYCLAGFKDGLKGVHGKCTITNKK
jgi:rhamnosyltransferase